MSRENILACAFALVVCVSTLPAHADIYQYTDENGVLHFTNVDGGGKKRRRVKTETESPRRKPAVDVKSRSAAPARASSSKSDYIDIINSACDRHGVDPSLVYAIVKVESDYNAYALSRKGAMGLMQLMPQTAMNMNITNSFNPEENIDGGVRYLRYLLDRYEGNISLALAAYNSGESAVKRWGSIPPFKETQNYVKRILKIYNGTGGNDPFIPQYTTIYMGYSEDGSLIITDNPANHPGKNLKRKTH